MSEIATEYDAAVLQNSEVCVEDVLQRLLSALSQLPDLSSIDIKDGDIGMTAIAAAQSGSNVRTSRVISLKASLPDSDALWKILYGQETTLSIIEDYSKTNGVDLVKKQWEAGLELASRLCDSLSATELHSTASSSLVFGEGRMFRLTCMLLCCMALRQCPNPVTARWMRWQSLLFETLRLYQQYYYGDSSRCSVLLWCNHLLPAIAKLQSALLQKNAPQPSDPSWMAYYEAGVIYCAAALAVRTAVVNVNDIITETTTTTLLFDSLFEHLLRGRYELLLEHPWRKHHHKQLIVKYHADETRTQAAALAYFTIDHDDNGEDDKLLVGMKTVWSDKGIALLIESGWKARPNIWSIEYQWRMFLPHVNAMLLGGDVDDADGEDCCFKDGSDNNGGTITARGFNLLARLLQQTEPRSLPRAQSDSVPNSPIGTCQLIANQIVAAGSVERKIHDDAQDADLFPPHQSLPNAAQAFQLMKQLVAKYCPSYQVDIVRKLLQDSPHPGLRPKLLDLLRDFVAWNDAIAEREVWLLFEKQFLMALECRISDGTIVANADDLIDDVETFQAALGLLQLWIMCKRTCPAALINLESRLRHVHAVVREIVTSWSGGSMDDSSRTSNMPHHLERHRLNLLENSLQQTVGLLQNVHASLL